MAVRLGSKSNIESNSLSRTTSFDSYAVLVLESTIPDGRTSVGRQPGLSGTKTNSAQTEAGARAELGHRFRNLLTTKYEFTNLIYC